MSTTENRKNLIYFIEEGGRTLDYEFIDKFVHPDVILPEEHFPGGQRGREALKDGLRNYDKIFQGTIKVEDSIAEGDKVAIRIVTRATHTGEFLGIKPTGKYFECDEIMIADFKDGQVVRFARIANLYGLIQQLSGAAANRTSETQS
jgi:predicted ester cyclase